MGLLCIGAEIEKFSYDHCSTPCTPETYGSQECFHDCIEDGFKYGDCANRTPKDPILCCCYN